jgi:hypothetical protein
MQFLIKENSWIAKLAARKLHAKRVAIVFGKTIHLFNIHKDEFLNDSRLLKHEMCHVRQYQRHGFLMFIMKYLWQSIRHGYYNNPFEKEARDAEND